MATFLRYLLLVFMCMGLAACSRLSAPAHESAEVAEPNVSTVSELARTLAPLKQANAGQSGVALLPDGREALAARLGLINAAQRSIDVQYYIWNDDVAGLLMFDALKRAADRGVAVRLLLDDNNTKGMDALLWGVDQHENIQVRLFNPFVHRDFRFWSYLTDFKRLNRRMHNKSLTVDNAASILGGRNIGDAYFELGQETLFVDLDVLAVGPVAKEVTDDFDKYWSSESSYPVWQVMSAPAEKVSITERANEVRRLEVGRAYHELVSEQSLVDAIQNGSLVFHWAPVHLVSDDPKKALGLAQPGKLVIDALPQLLGTPHERLMVVSPYLVPTSNGTQFFTQLADRGVEVRILTNSLAATDVAVVHSGYAKWRKALLNAGVTLFEMKPAYSVGQVGRPAFSGSSSASSLHAKTFAVDSSHLFVGSFNFDPRSARLNTEMGLVIESPEMVSQVWDNVQDALAQSSYQVGLDPAGNLIWRDHSNDPPIAYESEPETNVFSRSAVWLMSKLPLDWLL
ncbi:phospholipase D family protein [Pusillimonas sp. DMV24BSW_D]|uniref:phospholipase D family protein n=1 Tax=Neopusillimonas aestuarii TaxID=2716226 RepID=UPI0014091C8F|nr:phospholipase D family protein [Pusillimonas sp. DMV24BSW_D]QIM50097.1 phospholipase D family protein [Pusillimonas sp. DMV24BSW_D]